MATAPHRPMQTSLHTALLREGRGSAFGHSKCSPTMTGGSAGAPDHVGEALGVGGVAGGVAAFVAFVVEHVPELPLHRARGGLADRARGRVIPEAVVRADGAHAVHDRAHVAPRHVQRVRAAVRRPPAAHDFIFKLLGQWTQKSKRVQTDTETGSLPNQPRGDTYATAANSHMPRSGGAGSPGPC